MIAAQDAKPRIVTANLVMPEGPPLPKIGLTLSPACLQSGFAAALAVVCTIRGYAIFHILDGFGRMVSQPAVIIY